jgi:Uma2 family endonuclease
VVEILSPGNSRRHVQQKMGDYASARVREAWILDRNAKSVTVFHLERSELREAACFQAGQRVRSRVLPRLALPLTRLFG